MRQLSLGRRAVALVAAAVTALAALVAAPVAAATGPEPARVTDLGPAIMSVNVRNAAFAELSDGTPVVYAISNGNPATFTMVDVTTGESLFAAELPGTTLGSFITVAGDGTVYFSARHPMLAGLFSFEPRTHELVQIAENVAGERVLYDGAVTEDGKLFFGTYPHAKVVSYDPATGAFRDYGSQTDEAAYVFSLGIVDGEVWAGTGPVPHLYAIDPASGERREVEVPARLMSNTQWFIGIAQRGDDVLVRLSPRGGYDTAVLHLATGEWDEDIIPAVGGSDPTATDVRGRSFVLSDGMLTAYNTRTDSVTTTGFADTDLPAHLAQQVNTYGIEVMSLPGRDMPAQSVVGLSTDGDIWAYNLATGSTSIRRAAIAPSPAEAHGLGVGPDGNAYIGAYLSSGSMSRVDAATLGVEPLRGPKQGDAITTHDGELVVTSYPGAVVHVGDLDQPWEWGTNPRHVLTIGRGEPHFQDRIFGVVSTGDRLALGTVPDYGEVGGALTLLDTATGAYEVHRDVVPGQSIVSLVHRDGIVYGGTAVSGGLSSTPTASSARLFAWDVAAEKVVWESEVSPGAGYVGGLAWGPDGVLVAHTSDGLLVETDPATGEVSRTVRTAPAESGAHTSWGYSARTVWDAASGSYVATNNGRLYQVHRADSTVAVLSTDMEQVVRDGAGNYIAVDDTNVFHVELGATG
ncbi:hypothetical protein [Georgenia subflava]|uniref:PQQ-binding-like beta-propeller repeat protein n=1 Tax=Georgenia subflava TaxID=1622177 RepID=A0A6N7EED4_9MICO|nr:hypothetical protein [Georgenia subflava]MPV36469.1 hypothetical protein [Georgenia subflava]